MRICKRCSRPYQYAPNSGGGTKYCAPCRPFAYREASQRCWNGGALARIAICEACGTEPASRRGRCAGWGLCEGCLLGIPSMFVPALLKHHAPLWFVRRVAEDPACAACRVDLRLKVQDNRGRLRYQFAVDHDHSCCPGNISCGRCLRGMLCQHCNAALGFLRDDHERIARLAEYVQKQTTTCPDPSRSLSHATRDPPHRNFSLRPRA